MSFTAEDYQALLAQLEALADSKYKAFHQGLVPGAVLSYGLPVPQLRQLARQAGREDPEGFLSVSQPGSYEETMIRGFVIAGMKGPMAQRLPLIESFLPLIDNWAVCDCFCASLHPKKPEDRALLWQFIQPFFADSREYYARFAAVVFLSCFVDREHIGPGLRLLESMTQEQYYVRMAAAWALSVCYVKFPQETLALLTQRTLPAFTQNKAIQKIRESRRVGAEEKEMLLQYKITKSD